MTRRLLKFNVPASDDAPYKTGLLEMERFAGTYTVSLDFAGTGLALNVMGQELFMSSAKNATKKSVSKLFLVAAGRTFSWIKFRKEADAIAFFDVVERDIASNPTYFQLKPLKQSLTPP